MRKEITIDELRTYAYCGRYYKAYKDVKDIELYNPFGSEQYIYFLVWRWMLYQFMVEKVVPSELEILDKAAEIKELYKAQEKVILFSDMNRIVANVLTIRELTAHFQNITALNELQSISVGNYDIYFFEYFTTTNSIYLFNYYETLYEFYESLDIALLAYKYKNNLPRYISFYTLEASGNLVLNRYPTRSLIDYKKSVSYIDTLIAGIEAKAYNPIYACRNTNCAYFQQCTNTRKL
jgi:hypothetical protein